MNARRVISKRVHKLLPILGIMIATIGASLMLGVGPLYEYFLMADFDHQGAPNQMLMVEASLMKLLSFVVGVPMVLVGVALFMWWSIKEAMNI